MFDFSRTMTQCWQSVVGHQYLQPESRRKSKCVGRGFNYRLFQHFRSQEFFNLCFHSSNSYKLHHFHVPTTTPNSKQSCPKSFLSKGKNVHHPPPHTHTHPSISFFHAGHNTQDPLSPTVFSSLNTNKKSMGDSNLGK